MRRVPTRIGARLTAAAAIIANRGLDDSKIDDLANAAGIPKATLYYYFTGKEQILSFLLAQMLQRLSDDVGAAVRASGTAAERLKAVVEALTGVIAEQPDACRALIGDLGRVARMPEITAMVETSFIDPVAELLSEGAVDGSLVETPDSRVTAAAIFGSIAMTGLYFFVEDLPWSPSITANSLSALLANGLHRSPGVDAESDHNL